MLNPCYYLLHKIHHITQIKVEPPCERQGFESHSRAFLGDLYDINKSQKIKSSLRNKGLSYKQENKYKHNETELDLLIRKIDSITKSCTKAYFNKILKNLAKVTPSNTNWISFLFLIIEQDKKSLSIISI